MRIDTEETREVPRETEARVIVSVTEVEIVIERDQDKEADPDHYLFKRDLI